MTAAVALRPSRRDVGAYVGMVIFLGAWGMCFAGLFFSYAVVRSTAPSWPPAGLAHLPLGLPLVNTALLALSSYTFHRGLVAVRAGRERALLGWLGLTLPLGLAFLALQTVVWVQVERSGLRWDTAVYGSVFYALTVFHALHVLTGLFAIVFLIPGAVAGKYTARRHNAVRMCSMFWHFVDGIWVIMFLSVYVF